MQTSELVVRGLGWVQTRNVDGRKSRVAQSKPTVKVRYSVVHSILYAPTYVALTKGFSEVGLDVAMSAQGGE